MPFVTIGLVNHSISDFGLAKRAKMTLPGLQELWFLSDGALINAKFRAGNSILALKTDWMLITKAMIYTLDSSPLPDCL